MRTHQGKSRRIFAAVEKLENRQLLSTIYVDASAPGATKNGTSWEYAFTDLQTALTAAVSGDTIKVADGTYKPTTETDRNVSFNLKSGVGLYGGYAGFGASDPETRGGAYGTILSGDIGTVGKLSDNSYHVVTTNGATIGSTLDGLAITGGGAGWGTTNPSYENGGGVYGSGNIFIQNCEFIGNRGISGGGFFLNSGQATLANCLFSGNYGQRGGGACITQAGKANFINCTLYANEGGTGVAVSTDSQSSASMTNCIIWGNLGSLNDLDGSLTISHSDVQGGYTGTANIDMDPQIIRTPWIGSDGIWGTGDDDYGDLRVKAGSATLNAGSNLVVTAATDIVGVSRIQDSVVDMGAYEGIYAAPASKTLYVDVNATGANNGTTWSNAFVSLQSALTAAADGDTIKVADGIYKPTTGTDRSISFMLRENVGIYGGYSGFGATIPDLRMPSLYPTVLSGDIGTVGVKTDNSNIVVTAKHLNGSGFLDGVTMALASDGGEGLWINSSHSYRIRNCSIVQNSYFGMLIENSNITFEGDDISLNGKGFWCKDSSLSMVNCTIAGNTGSKYSAYETWATSLSFTNSIIWGNGNDPVTSHGVTPSVNFCDFQGGIAGTGNINFEPLFVSNPTAGPDGLVGTGDDDLGDLRLRAGSPALNAGLNSAVMATTDIAGNARIVDGTVDMGAYEGAAVLTAKTWYVDVNAAGANNGTTWASAYTSLASALSVAISGDMILMADGVYKPTTGTDRTISFALKNGVSIFGGYAGYGASDPNARDILINKTILSGDIGTAGVITDNSYSIFKGSNLTSLTTLNGLSIAYAYYNSSGNGAVLVNGSSKLSIVNCSFYGNNSFTCVYADSSTVQIANCQFVANSGSAIFSNKSSVTLLNSTLAGNSGSTIILQGSSTAQIANCIIWAGGYKLISNSSSTLTITNSDVQQTTAGVGNINQDPLFVRTPWTGYDGVWGTADDDLGDLRLTAGSPCLNMGSNSALTTTTDISGNPRIADGTVDMGAFEGSFAAPAGKILFVDANSTGTKNGTSWSNAFTDLQSAIGAATDGDVIRIADGVYKPSAANRTVSFQLRNRVSIIGGYAGFGASDPDAWDTNSFITSLSGDIGVVGTRTDNSYHVVVANGVSDLAILKGVSIVDGYAQGSGSYQDMGGGILVQFGSQLRVEQCRFMNNVANSGGGVYTFYASPTFVGCTFFRNRAFFEANWATNGSAIMNDNSSPRYENSLFIANEGIILIEEIKSTTSLTGCTVVQNIGDDLYKSDQRTSVISNSIIYSNEINKLFTSNPATIVNSDVMGGNAGSGNINADPRFVRMPWSGPDGVWGTSDDDQGDLRLRTGSPALNAGLNSAVQTSTDIAGHERVLGPAVDMGAYEGSVDIIEKTLYVDAAATGDNDGTSWENAFKSLQSAILTSRDGDTIKLAAGTYKPTDGLDQSISFNLKNGVSILGGYLGVASTTPDQRDLTKKTILSGDIGVSGDRADNSKSMIVCRGFSTPMILDGLVVTMTLGNTSAIVIKSCADITISHSQIEKNRGVSGSAVNALGSYLKIYDTTISANQAGIGALFLDYTTAIMRNCTLVNNQSNDGYDLSPGTIFLRYNCSLDIANSIIWNCGGVSIEIASYGSSVATASYSDIEGGYAGTGNINVRPSFVRSPWIGPDGTWGTPDDDAGDLRLRSGSAGLDAGSNDAIVDETDVSGNPRIAGIYADMGAYEGSVDVTQKTIYVDDSALGANDGTSWNNAFTSLQAALRSATDGDTIKLAGGTYKATSGTNSTLSFALRDGTSIIGGYAGSGAANPDERDLSKYQTILSGEIGDPGKSDDNTNHILSAYYLDAPIVIDGLIITGGYAPYPVISRGAGMYTYFAADLRIFNCSFVSNFTYKEGAGACFEGSKVKIVNSVFERNNSRDSAGSIYTNDIGYLVTTAAHSAITDIINCTIVNNNGGMIVDGITTIRNSIIWLNGLYPISNSDTLTVEYCDVQGGYAGTGNLNVDPGLVRLPSAGADGVRFTADDDIGDLRLGADSPLLDAGTSIDESIASDRQGKPRIFGARVDLGAYEGGYSTSPRTLYVDFNAKGAKDGSSWANAFISLTSAISVAADRDEIRVADGVYLPTTTTDRAISFQLRNRVSIFGGYAGFGAANPNARNVDAFPTILSGNIGSSSSQTDNSYHVVVGSYLSNQTLLDGLTITQGYANNSSVSANGGGLFLYPFGDLTLNQCKFVNNFATDDGGGLYAQNSSPTIKYSVFRGNEAFMGGGLYLYYAKSDVSNTLFTNNSHSNGRSNGYGGGIFTMVSSLAASGCTFASNNAYEGGAAYISDQSTFTLKNSVVWMNGSNPIDKYPSAALMVSYCDVQYGFAGAGNINADPKFVGMPWTGPDNVWNTPDDDPGDFRLRTNSPALNTGDNSAVATTTDLAGKPRIINGIVDMGAYEGAVSVVNKTLYVDLNAPGANNGSSWANAYTNLQSALAAAKIGVSILMADGTYKPTTDANRAISFALRYGVPIYGGYAGFGAANPDARDVKAFKTILSGDIGLPGVPSDNSYHVVTAMTTAAVMDGLTIANGYANGYDDNQKNGGGILALENSDLSLNKCEFENNFAESGAGIYVSNSTFNSIDCGFHAGMATYGGGVSFEDSTASIINGVFERNSATRGAAIYSGSTTLSLVNDTIAFNLAATSGGALDGVSSSDCSVSNCTIWFNGANSINGSITAKYSDIEGGYSGTGNINADPLFVKSPCNGPDQIMGTPDDDPGDYRLRIGSLALNAGNNANVAVDTDYSGNPRIENVTVDMGAIEGATTVVSRTLYVDAHATGAGNGSSWVNAFRNLQDSIMNAVDGDSIKVADGTYYPTATTDRNLSIVLRRNVSLYGGYAGAGAADPNSRDFSAYPTILSGDIKSANSRSDNSRHVLSVANVSGTIVIEGFTVTQGYADGSANNQNNGGAILALSAGTLSIRSCVFMGNYASNFGGAVYAKSTNLQLYSCSIIGNSASTGGAVYNDSSTATLSNCTILMNSASNGAALTNSSSSATVINSIAFLNGSSVFFNATTSSSISVTFSAIQGGYTGMGNISSYPKFVRLPWTGPDGVMGTNDDDAGDLRLKSDSQAINTASTSDVATDIDNAGKPRIVDSKADMGAYEGGVSITEKTIYVDLKAVGANDGTSWTNAFKSLQSALAAASDGDSIKIADGTYKPTSGWDRTLSFALRNGVSIYGGYAGFGAPNPNARDVVNTPTLLSGDISTLDSTADNSYHVVTAYGLITSTLLDGLTLKQGNANGSGTRQNLGSAIYAQNNSGLKINACSLYANTSSWGTLCLDNSSADMTNCQFVGNTSTSGGIIYVIQGSFTLLNSDMVANTGAAMSGTSPFVTDLNNTIIWNSGSISMTVKATVSDIQGTTSYGSINVNPQFVRSPWMGNDATWGTSDDDYGDLRLRAGSLALDAGLNSAASTSTDLAGNPRIQGEKVDLGAFEGAVSVESKVIYVDVNATGSGNGTSWDHAFTNLSAAIRSASDFDVIHIADGVYTPESARSSTFALRNGMSIMGGYAGVGAVNPDARDFAANATILSGNIGNTDLSTDNNYHVVYIWAANTVSIDGVVITGGYAYGSGPDQNAGGIFASLSNVNISNCKIIQNSSINNGGGIYAVNSTLTISNSIVSANLSLNQGGGLHATSSTINVKSSDLAFNISQKGGGLYLISSALNASNSIIWGNAAIDSDQIYSSSGTPNITYSVVKGGASGTGNISMNPLFVRSAWAGEDGVYGTLDDDAGDLRLRANSPAANAGNNTGVTFDADLAGNVRIQNATVDIGAYEGATSVVAKTIYVDANATGADNGASWVDAFNHLQSALRASADGDQIRIADGTYKPTTSGPRTSSFVLRNGVSIFGGYGGYGSANPDIRNTRKYPAILSGDIGIPDASTDNAYHVVEGFNLDSGLLDGVTIVQGYADGNNFMQNLGGGVFTLSSNLKLTGVRILGNYASSNGGGIYNNAALTLVNSVLIGNASNVGNGGGVYCGQNSVIVNCDFWDNRLASGNGMEIYSSSFATISNSIIWRDAVTTNLISGTFTTTYSDVLGNSSGTGNKNLDPKYYRNPSNGLDDLWGTSDDYYGDLRLQPSSPCIDAGNDSANTLDLDIAGNARRIDMPGCGVSVIDMGAYETALPTSLPGSTNDDVYYARVSSDGDKLDVWQSSNATGDPQFTYDLDASGIICIDLGAGNDTLILDLSAGDRLPISMTNIETVRILGATATTDLLASSNQLIINNTLIPCDATPQVQLSECILHSLSLSGNAIVKLNADSLVVTNSNAASIRQYVRNGVLGATPAILGTTTLAVLDNSRLHKTQFAGQTLASPFSQILIQAAKPGDANLDGKIDQNDLMAIYANLNRSNTGWLGGDLDQDGIVNLSDLALVQSKLSPASNLVVSGSTKSTSKTKKPTQAQSHKTQKKAKVVAKGKSGKK